jgi:NTP pyrophosphatase (non-canonical NTP hydrolase)
MSGTDHVEWWDKASENVEKWGIQDIETLLLAMQEEMGELAQAYLEARSEGGDHVRIGEELADLAALCIQLQWALNDRSIAPDTGRVGGGE